MSRVMSLLTAALLLAPMPILSASGSRGAAAQTIAPVPAVPPPTNTGRVLTDAPVPNAPAEQVAPADRAGSRTATDAGPLNSTPFSSLPGGQMGGGSVSPAERDRAGGVLPNLSK